MFNFHKERRCKGRIEKLNETNDRDDFTGNLSVFIYFSRFSFSKFHLNFRDTSSINA
jgi:hypothetical protein